MIRQITRRARDYWYNLVAQWSRESFQTDSTYWDDDISRQVRYYLYERYYANDIFTTLNQFKETYKKQNNYYKYIRSIYNPVYRIVEGFVAATYGSPIDIENLDVGALAVITDDLRLRDDISNLLQVSQFNRHKSLYGRFAAKYGDSFLKVVDDVDKGTVTIEVVDPRLVETVIRMGDDIVYARITYDDLDMETGRYTTYTEEYTLDTIRIYNDVTPFGIGEVTGKLIDEYPNLYGFIPIEHARFKDNGSHYGVNSFFALQSKIDEINDTASLLNDNIRNTVQQLYHAKGVNKGGLSSNNNEPTRDDIKIIYTRADAQIIPITNSLNIEGVLSNIDRMQEEIDRDTPVLSLHKLRDMSVVTAPAARAMYTDAVNQILEVQSNLDTPLERIIVKALAISTFRGITSGYTYTTDYNFTLKPREVIPSKLSALEMVQSLMNLDMSHPNAKLAMEKIGIPEERINEALALAQSRQLEELENELVRSQLASLNTMRQPVASNSEPNVVADTDRLEDIDRLEDTDNEL